MSDTYLSNIIKNVSVPAGVPITPNQAFVNAMAKQFSSGMLDWSNCGIVSIVRTTLATFLGSIKGCVTNYNFSGNLVADSTNLDALLGAFVDAGVSGSTINVSGGTMATVSSSDSNLVSLLASGNTVYYNGAVPVNTAAPTLSSTTYQVGVPLTCAYGTWTNSPTSYSYQWQASSDGATWADIGGATGASYTPVSGDVGNLLRCGVKATNGAGTSTTAYSGSASGWRIGLAGEYLFTPGSELLDTSGNGNTLTNNGGVTFSGGVASFDGSNYLSSTGASQNSNTTATYSCILTTTADSTNEQLGTSDVAGSETTAFENVQGYINDGGWHLEGSDYNTGIRSSINTAGRYHLILRFNGDGTYDFFVEGTLIGTNSGTTTIAGNTLCIGNDLINSGGGDSSIEQVRVWNRALSDAEVALISGL